MKAKIGIIGGGLAGLSVAYFLREYKPIILEKEDKIGGLCRSKAKDGFTYDIGGSHIIFSRDQEILNLILELLGENVEKHKRNTKILYKDRLVKYPFENGIGDLEKEERIECLDGYVQALVHREKNPAPPISFYDWILWKFGKGFAEKYMIPYNEKIWKYDLKEMSSDWVEGRIPDPKFSELLKAALELDSEGYTHQLYYWYPKKGGIEALIQALAQYNAEKILTGQKITRIEKKDKKWVVTTAEREFEFDILISTIHVREFLKLLALDHPQEVVQAAEALLTNRLINVFIGIKGKVKEKFQNLSWMYLPSWQQGYFHRVSFPSTFSNLNAPENCSGINVEITALNDSAIWQKTDETILQEVISSLEDMYLIDKEKVIMADVHRWQHAYVIFDKHYSKNIQQVQDYLSKIGVFSIGRFAQMQYLNMDHIVKNAYKCAKEVEKHCKEMIK